MENLEYLNKIAINLYRLGGISKLLIHSAYGASILFNDKDSNPMIDYVRSLISSEILTKDMCDKLYLASTNEELRKLKNIIPIEKCNPIGNGPNLFSILKRS